MSGQRKKGKGKGKGKDKEDDGAGAFSVGFGMEKGKGTYIPGTFGGLQVTVQARCGSAPSSSTTRITSSQAPGNKQRTTW